MALDPWPQIRKGHKAHPVLTLQYLLRAHGHTVTPDDEFGPQTETAVRAFQTAKRLTVDGIAGPQTWQALVTTVRRGDRSDSVRAAQQEFEYRSKPLLVVDGEFGPATEDVVRRWQQFVKDRGETAMIVDGVVGPQTWQSLISGMYFFFPRTSEAGNAV
ncbi:peptidoglycan-binding protein [Actinoplanes sp. NBRC 101535]|nr:peptidoglycan-binding protein [Actinoplanes sp. NBRC 101535]